MTHSTHIARPAGIAIAAALALGTTPSLAQMAPDPLSAAPEPVLVIPQSPPPAAPPPAPAIVLPTELPAAAPVTQEEAAPPVRAAAAPTTRAAATPTTRAAAAPPPPQRVTAPAAAPVEPVAEAAPVAEELAPLPVAESEPLVPFTAAEAPVEETASQPAGTSTTALLVLLGALLAIGLAIWGFIAIGRRKTVDRKAVPVARRPAVTPPAPHPEPIAAETIPAAPVVAPTRIDRPAPAPSMAHSGAAVPLPRTMPATFEEREALIKRMVAARPDRANPFTAPLQRRRRARLILQSLGRDFGQAEPWIDLSQYPANWPELAGRKHAAA